MSERDDLCWCGDPGCTVRTVLIGEAGPEMLIPLGEDGQGDSAP